MKITVIKKAAKTGKITSSCDVLVDDFPLSKK